MHPLPLWKRITILGVCLCGILFALPTFIAKQHLNFLPQFMQNNQVNLGLDLQGGSHLLLEIDIKSAAQDRLENLAEETRTTLRKGRINYRNLKVVDEKVTFDLADSLQTTAVQNLLQDASQHTQVDVKDTQVTRFYTQASTQLWAKNILNQSRHIVENRINQLGTREPNIQTQGDNRIIVQLPGVENPGQAKAILGTTAKLVFKLVHPDYPTLASNGGRIIPGTDAIAQNPAQSRGNEQPPTYLVKKQVLLTGENLIDAQVSFNQTGQPEVAIKFDTPGGRKFGEITKNNIGALLAIILDDKVISAPHLNVAIYGGNAVIQGNFTVEEASNLALLMRAGSLPAPISVIEERTVGPDLGADSIKAGKNATLFSIVLVGIFMIVAYTLFGVFANIALIINMVLLISALALTGSTLTLPGIAGIALTLGMAVDANVLIYERIKEELRMGRKIAIAVEAGYERAMATILDSNITTLIGAAALYIFGSGPIKGFGVTLAMGIIISMFTAISLTRLLTVTWINWRRPQQLSI